MAGVKGRSGRRPWSQEKDLKTLWNKAAPIVIGYLCNQKVSEENRIHVALEVIKKMIPATATIQSKNTTDISISLIDVGLPREQLIGDLVSHLSRRAAPSSN